MGSATSCRAVLAAGLAALALAAEADAHIGLRQSEPAAGAALGAGPTAVRLTFSEPAEASLASVEVVGEGGGLFQAGVPVVAPDDPYAIAVRLRELPRGVYTVTWRVVSSVDGHATGGAFSFGVGAVPPAGGAASVDAPRPSALELLGRWAFLAGLVLLVGASVATAAGFGGRRADPRLAGGGWALAVAGLGLVAAGQLRIAEVGVGEFLETDVGGALLERGAALAAAGAALAAFRQTQRFAASVAAVAGLAAAAAHVAAGHAAAGAPALAIAAQWAHVAAAAVWIGGLAALVLAVRGLPTEGKAAALRRFSMVAAAALGLVVATGTLRAVEELTAWSDLWRTGYGRALAVKVALVAALAALGLVNRRRSLPAASTRLGLFRRVSAAELALAGGVVAAAALLGTLPPPAAGRVAPPPGIEAEGVDSSTSVRARLRAASRAPGPNRFAVELEEAGSGEPLGAGRVALRFTPLEDPSAEATSLALTPGADGAYVGSGGNLASEGVWEVAVVVERAAGPVEVPLVVDVAGEPQFLSVERMPGRPPKYDVYLASGAIVRFSPAPERAGAAKLYLSFFDVVGDPWPVQDVALSVRAGEGRPRRTAPRRMSPGRYVADAELAEGANRLTALARADDGTRLRAKVEIDVPAG